MELLPFWIALIGVLVASWLGIGFCVAGLATGSVPLGRKDFLFGVVFWPLLVWGR